MKKYSFSTFILVGSFIFALIFGLGNEVYRVPSAIVSAILLLLFILYIVNPKAIEANSDNKTERLVRLNRAASVAIKVVWALALLFVLFSEFHKRFN